MGRKEIFTSWIMGEHSSLRVLLYELSSHVLLHELGSSVLLYELSSYNSRIKETCFAKTNSYWIAKGMETGQMMCACVCACSSVCACMLCVCVSQSSSGVSFSVSSIWLFETGILTCARNSSTQLSWLDHKLQESASTSPDENFQRIPLTFVTWIMGSELRSSCLYRKHYTGWTIIPAQKDKWLFSGKQNAQKNNFDGIIWFG